MGRAVKSDKMDKDVFFVFPADHHFVREKIPTYQPSAKYQPQQLRSTVLYG